jgi:hypothetical protein
MFSDDNESYLIIKKKVVVKFVQVLNLCGDKYIAFYLFNLILFIRF